LLPGRHPWRDLPERFGDWKNTHRRFSRWARTAVWQGIFEHLPADADNEYAMIDRSRLVVLFL
jgi:transposase